MKALIITLWMLLTILILFGSTSVQITLFAYRKKYQKFLLELGNVRRDLDLTWSSENGELKSNAGHSPISAICEWRTGSYPRGLNMLEMARLLDIPIPLALVINDSVIGRYEYMSRKVRRDMERVLIDAQA